MEGRNTNETPTGSKLAEVSDKGSEADGHGLSFLLHTTCGTTCLPRTTPFLSS